MEQEPETQLITDEECVEAMRLGKSEIVQRWHIGQEKIADQVEKWYHNVNGAAGTKN